MTFRVNTNIKRKAVESKPEASGSIGSGSSRPEDAEVFKNLIARAQAQAHRPVQGAGRGRGRGSGLGTRAQVAFDAFSGDATRGVRRAPRTAKGEDGKAGPGGEGGKRKRLKKLSEKEGAADLAAGEEERTLSDCEDSSDGEG